MVLVAGVDVHLAISSFGCVAEIALLCLSSSNSSTAGYSVSFRRMQGYGTEYTMVFYLECMSAVARSLARLSSHLFLTAGTRGTPLLLEHLDADLLEDSITAGPSGFEEKAMVYDGRRGLLLRFRGVLARCGFLSACSERGVLCEGSSMARRAGDIECGTILPVRRTGSVQSIKFERETTLACASLHVNILVDEVLDS